MYQLIWWVCTNFLLFFVPKTPKSLSEHLKSCNLPLLRMELCLSAKFVLHLFSTKMEKFFSYLLPPWFIPLPWPILPPTIPWIHPDRKLSTACCWISFLPVQWAEYSDHGVRAKAKQEAAARNENVANWKNVFWDWGLWPQLELCCWTLPSTSTDWWRPCTVLMVHSF